MPAEELFVDIPVDGEWPSSDDLDARNAIIDELDELNLGEFIGSGGGLGSMDFSYSFADGDAARRAIETLMEKHLPGREFSIEVCDD
jgi:hypothetical protein